jgi:CO/xanthine dehydrogenase FAD-binding subunit
MAVNSRVLAHRIQLLHAADLSEVLDTLSRYGSRAAVLCGGTDLVVKMKRGVETPEVVINCREVSDVRGIEARADTVQIGAATALETVAGHPLVERDFPVLSAALRSIAGPAIRSMGTLGGNVMNASPAADSVVALLAYRARFHLRSQAGERVVPASEFFVGPGRTVRRPDELLTAVVLDRRGAGVKRRGHFQKVGRVAGDIAKVNVAVVAEREGAAPRWYVALGAVAPTAVRLPAVEALLNRVARLNAALLSDIRQAVAEAIHPIDDVRSTAWYRRRVAGITVADLVAQTWQELEAD